MIPLLWIFLGWALGVALFSLLALLTVSLAMRFGLMGATTYVVCGLFLVVGAVLVLGPGTYLLTVDWSQSITLIPSLEPASGLLFP